MASNKVMLTITKFLYSIAHNLMKPPQNMTQLVVGERRGVEF